MSLLDQAKKEAKRLFNLAKNNQEPHTLSIPQLSTAREVTALINGYKNWHDYEEVLKKKDLVFNNIDKNRENKTIKKLLENKKYFIQDIAFNTIENPIAYQKQNQIIVKQEHKNIVLGYKKEKTLFENKEKCWILNQYPMFVTGGTGAGKTEFLLSLSMQYINNHEGLIYIESKADVSLYSKIFSYALSDNRINDLYCLNFLRGTYEYKSANEKEQTKEELSKLSHSIDPINPMVGNDSYFTSYFGAELGQVIHAILKSIHKKHQLMDLESLESTLMLNNLIKWHKNLCFGEQPELKEYLISLGLTLDSDHLNENNLTEEELEQALEQHTLKAQEAYNTVQLLKTFKHVFRIDASVDMEQIFLKRKILFILFPALMRTTEETRRLSDLISAQIRYVEEKNKLNMHLQNIICDEFIYYSNELKNIDFNQTKNNYIFACQDFEFLKHEGLMTIFNQAKTYLAMKSYEPEIPVKLQLDLLNNVADLSKEILVKDFISNLKLNLKDQQEGTGYIFCLNKKVEENYTSPFIKDKPLLNDENKYYLQKLNCIYLPASRPKEVWLPQQDKPVIYIKKINKCYFDRTK